jgi:hypothetical protein
MPCLAGETANVTFTITAESLALVDDKGDTLLVEGLHDVRISQGNGDATSEVARTVAVPKGSGAMLRKFEWCVDSHPTRR